MIFIDPEDFMSRVRKRATERGINLNDQEAKKTLKVVKDILHQIEVESYDDIYEKVDGKKIRAERLRQDLTAKALGQAAGLSYTTIALTEMGRTRPRPLTLYKIASALGCDSNDFLVQE